MKSDSLPLWAQILVTLLVAAIPAFISWNISRQSRKDAKEAVERATAQAEDARQSAAEMERLRRLEDRTREAKVAAYTPLLQATGKMFEGGSVSKRPADEVKQQRLLLDAMNNFWVKGLMYASDPAQRAFGRMMQAAFADAPSAITLRLYSEFILAARRDLGDDRTTTTASEVWAPKLNDLYSSASVLDGFDTMRFDDLARKSEWEPPWKGTTLAHREDEELL